MMWSILLGSVVLVFGIGLSVYAHQTDEPPELRRAALAYTVATATAVLRSGGLQLLGGARSIEYLLLVGTVLGYGLGVHYLLKHYNAYQYVLPR